MGALPPSRRPLDVCDCPGCSPRHINGWTILGVVGLTMLFFAPGLIASYLIELPL